MVERLDLPEILEPYRAAIEATVRPCVRITPTLDAHTGPLDSKFGGYPYLPMGAEYPKDEDGQPMALLAQINFAEVPHIDPYPEKGILQFYVQRAKPSPFTYGLDYAHPTDQRNWRILWFPEPDAAQVVTDFSFLPADEILHDWTPLEYSRNCAVPTYGLALRMAFDAVERALHPDDYRFEQMLPGRAKDETFFDQFGEQENAAWQAYCALSCPDIHRIGGNPCFEQRDPRLWDPTTWSQITPDPDLMLLLQIGSDYDHYLMWGDVGIANFFIAQNDLIKRDFSRVRYHWDCG